MVEDATLSLSILLPAFNEGDGLGVALDHVAAILPQLGVAAEVIVIDDGSNDGTAALLARYAARTPWLRIARHATNRGKGAALRTGLQVARSPWVFYTDADLPVDLHVLPVVLPLTRHADMISGYRVGRRESLQRAFLSNGYVWLVRLLFGVSVKHLDFPFKLFKRSLCDRITLTADDFFFDTELLIKLHRLGCRIHQVPVTYQPRRTGQSKVLAGGILRQMQSCAKQLWKLRFERSR